MGFNPRPAREGRAASRIDRLAAIFFVSILAQPVRAGRQASADAVPAEAVGFNPRPAREGRAAGCERTTAWRRWQFQSSPSP